MRAPSVKLLIYCFPSLRILLVYYYTRRMSACAQVSKDTPYFWASQAMVPGPPPAPGGARDHLCAQGHRLGIYCGGPPGGGAPGERESAARGRDLSVPNPAVHSAAAPI